MVPLLDGPATLMVAAGRGLLFETSRTIPLTVFNDCAAAAEIAKKIRGIAIRRGDPNR